MLPDRPLSSSEVEISLWLLEFSFYGILTSVEVPVMIQKYDLMSPSLSDHC